MAQHDQNIANDTSANVRADMNNALAALFSSSSGSSAPSTTIAYQFWADTTNGLLKIRNATNSAWIVVGAFDASGFRFLPAAASASTPAYSTESDTNTGIWFPSADTWAVAIGGTEAFRLNSDRQSVHPAGSASVPVITTTGDLNTGVFFPAADTIAWATGGTERGRMDSSGRLLWNESSAPVYSGSRASFWAKAASQAALEAVNTSTSGNTIICRINDTSSNWIAFDLAGSVIGSINSNGSITQYNTTSDARLKADVEDLHDVGFVLDAIRPVSFRWRATGALDVGFIAQELGAAWPRAVTEGDDGPEVLRPWQVDESKLMPLVIRELQALRARVAALEGAP
jgi:hypothetical protein